MQRYRRKRYIFLLGFISMLMPLAVDMYLSAMPAMAKFFATNEGQIQLTLSSYILGFALGQLIYGPISDSIGRKPVIIYGILTFALVSLGCAFVENIDQLIVLRFFHGLTAASAAVVINALLRDTFKNQEFSKMLSMVLLVSNIAPLTAPLMGGWILYWLNWQAIFITLGILGLFTFVLAMVNIKETLIIQKRHPFSLIRILRNFVSIGTNPAVLCFMLTTSFSFSGMFAFITAGSSVYIGHFGVSEIDFGYYFGLNIVFMMMLNITNTKLVKRLGVLRMLIIGISLQTTMSVLLIVVSLLELPFIFFVLCVSGYVGCIAMVSSNAMAMIMDKFPHIAGTASSLAGFTRFTIAALVGMVLAQIHTASVWPMVLTMSGCIILAALFAAIAVKITQNNSAIK
ncbi:Bcr/CflA family multidrug efflux MFS transporter [Thorsellia anophelis]|nr:Bcr/CflA family multidrug efflux MFS transporter [Thorsellia anophelis]